MQYRAEIDGLRAVAVVPVILFHAGISGFDGGFLGVDVFFVISGFLITAIITAELETGRFSLARFYERRARRILPALTVMMLVCLPFAWMWMLPSELVRFGRSLAATALFLSNVLYWRQTDYFSPDAELNPLLHTWSLSVEEQFYILFPLILMLMWRRSRRLVAPVLVLGILVSLALAEWGGRNAPAAAFFLAPSRAFELLLGALAALFVRRFGETRSGAASAAGLFMVVSAIAFLGDRAATPSLWTLIPVVGTALILVFGREGTAVAAILRIRPLVGIGLISYSLYLWHQPVLAFAKIRLAESAGGVLLAGLFVLIFLAGVASWAFVERPFRHRRGTLRGPGRMLALSAASIVGVAAIGALLSSGNGVYWRTTPAGEPFAEIALLEQSMAPNYGLDKSCRSTAPEIAPSCRTAPNPTTALWGDSFAMHLAQAIADSPTPMPFAQRTASQCGPIPGLAVMGSVTSWQSCLAFNDAALSWILSDEAVRTVIISSPFDQAARTIYRRDGTVIRDEAAGRAAVMKALVALSAQLADAGKRLVIVGPPPASRANLGVCYLRRRAMSLDDHACDFTVAAAAATNLSAKALLAELAPVIPVVRLEDLICDDEMCRASAGRGSVYRDGGHLSIDGSAWLGRQNDLAGIILRETATH
jgi:peptidoglycan/LPS O-acetylase OafA/YrhL